MTASPICLDRDWIQGATLTETFQLLDADGNPIDLTGYSGRMEVRNLTREQTGSVVIVTASVTVSVPATGTYKYTVTPTQSAGVSSITYQSLVSDIELYTAADADVLKPVRINWTMLPEVTT